MVIFFLQSASVRGLKRERDRKTDKLTVHTIVLQAVYYVGKVSKYFYVIGQVLI